MLAHYLLSEKLNLFGLLGCMLCVAGSLTIVLHAPEERPITSLLQVWQLALQPGTQSRSFQMTFYMQHHASCQCQMNTAHATLQIGRQCLPMVHTSFSAFIVCNRHLVSLQSSLAKHHSRLTCFRAVCFWSICCRMHASFALHSVRPWYEWNLTTWILCMQVSCCMWWLE